MLLSCLPLRFDDVIIRICEICYLFDGYVLTPVMLSYLPKLYVISLDLQGLLLFDGSLSYTSFVIMPRCRSDVIGWICKRTPFDGLLHLHPVCFIYRSNVITGIWCSVPFDRPGSPKQFSECLPKLLSVLLSLF